MQQVGVIEDIPADQIIVSTGSLVRYNTCDERI